MNIRILLLGLLTLNVVGYTHTASRHPFSISEVDGGPTNDPHLEKLWDEVQSDLGIISKVPLRWKMPDFGTHSNQETACANNKAVYLSRDSYLKAGGDPVKIRPVLFHEGVHVIQAQRRKELKGFLIAAIPVYCVSYIAGKLGNFVDQSSPLWLSCDLVATTIGSKLFIDSFQREREADIKGFTASQCAKCTQYIALLKPSPKSPNELIAPSEVAGQKGLQEGYISREECLAIAEKLKGKICRYHAADQQS